MSHRQSRKIVVDSLESRLLMSSSGGTKLVMGFLADYQIGNGAIANLNWSQLSQVDYFSVEPDVNGNYSDGGIQSASSSGYTYSDPTQLPALVSAGDAHNVPVWVAVGGGDTASINAMNTLLSPNTTDAQRETFATNMAALCSTYGVSGVDLDWEPASTDQSSVTNFGTLIADMHVLGLQTSADVLPQYNDIGNTGTQDTSSLVPLDATAVSALNYINIEEYATPAIGEPTTDTYVQQWIQNDIGTGNAYKIMYGVSNFPAGVDPATDVSQVVNATLGQSNTVLMPSMAGAFVWTLGDPSTSPDLGYIATALSNDGVSIAKPAPAAPSFASVSGSVSENGAAPSGPVTVYIDANNNGSFDAGEIFTTTDANGNYTLPEVPLSAGGEQVRQVLPSGYTQTTPASNAGIALPTLSAKQAISGDNFVDSNGNNNPPPPPVTYATVSGTVTSTTGQGVGGITIYLDSNNDSQLDNNELSTTTDGSGDYTFYNDVPAGSGTAYIVRQQMPLPGGDTQVTPAQNYGDHLPTTLVAGTTYGGQDFVDNVPVAVATATVSGTVTNAATGAGIGGITVYIDTNNNNTLDTGELSAITDSNGDYSIPNVPAGSSTAFIVRQELPLPGGDTQVTPTQGYGNHLPVPLTAGDTYSGQNFTDNVPAAAQTATVSGTVTDASGNGVANITIFLDANNDGMLDNGELSVTTNANGYYIFNDVPAGTNAAYIVRQEMPLPSGISQVTPSMNYGDHLPVPLVAGDTYGNQDFTDLVTSTKPVSPTPLTGTVIGTAGSYQNLGNTDAKAVDGNLSTFFDAPMADGAWVGLDLGSEYTITSIAFAPRSQYEYRMEGGVFQASNDPTFATGVAELYTIGSTAPADGLTTVAVATPGAYRYVRYLSPDGGWGNVAEVQFFGNAATANAATILSGAVIGTTGSYQNLGNTSANAFDGNVNTFFDAPAPDYQWVGLDLGSGYDLSALAFAPRAGFEYRMVGGIFQASNDPTFSTGVVNLYTVSSTPTSGTLTVVPLSVSGSYRYVRYLAPGGANGNVAEVEFFGTPASSQSATMAVAALPFADSAAIGIDDLV